MPKKSDKAEITDRAGRGAMVVLCVLGLSSAFKRWLHKEDFKFE